MKNKEHKLATISLGVIDLEETWTKPPTVDSPHACPGTPRLQIHQGAYEEEGARVPAVHCALYNQDVCTLYDLLHEYFTQPTNQ